MLSSLALPSRIMWLLVIEVGGIAKCQRVAKFNWCSMEFDKSISLRTTGISWFISLHTIGEFLSILLHTIGDFLSISLRTIGKF